MPDSEATAAQCEDGARRVLIVSHPAVLAVNQLPYAALLARGWDVRLVVPSRWRHEYADGAFEPQCLVELEGRITRRRAVPAGRVQRHIYRPGLARLLAAWRPDVAFVESEPSALAAAQWGAALRRARIPFGLQADENLRWRNPLVARATLRHATFVAARSPAAARLIAAAQPALAAPLIPHHVPPWPLAASEAPGERPFTVGFAGRLAPEKGVRTLADAVAQVAGARLVLAGDGALRAELLARRERGESLEVVSGLHHDQMPSLYASFDVLVLPSLTTSSWVEQFGRVLVEALWCGVPVIGSDSGEIPWVIGATGGGLVFPEGDVEALRTAIERLRGDPVMRATLARDGRAEVARRFSVERVTAELDAALRAAIG